MQGPSRRGHASVVLFLLLVLLVAARSAEGRACPAWPGEPDPLPTVDHPQKAQAEWARARVAELNRLALVLEPIDRIEAYRFWSHARCLDPGNEQIARRAEEVAAENVHRALGLAGDSPFEGPSGTAESVDGALRLALVPRRSDASAQVAAPSAPPPEREAAPAPEPAPVVVVRMQAVPETEPAEPAPSPVAGAPPPEPSPPEPVAPTPAPQASAPESDLPGPAVTGAALEADVPGPAVVAAAPPVAEPALPEPSPLDAVDVVLADAQRLIDQARFRSALELLPQVVRASEELPAEQARRDRVARAELLAGTAQIALGQEGAAQEHFRRALRAQPGLELGASTPPKVRRAFEAVRNGT